MKNGLEKRAEMSFELVRWVIPLAVLLLLLLIIVPPFRELGEKVLDKFKFPTGELPAVSYDEERIPVGTELPIYPPDVFVRKEVKGWKLMISEPGVSPAQSFIDTILENEDLVTVLNSDKLIGGEGYTAIKIASRTYVHAPNPEDTDPSTPDLMWFIDKNENYKYDGTDDKVTTEKVAEQILAMLYEIKS